MSAGHVTPDDTNHREDPAMTDTAQTTYAEQVAPWPKAEADVTADSLCRALTVEAARIDTGALLHAAENAPDEECRAARYRELGVRMQLKNRAAAVVWLLRMDIDPGAADEAARDLWSLWDRGDVDEWLGDWLLDYGIDLDRLDETSGETP